VAVTSQSATVEIGKVTVEDVLALPSLQEAGVEVVGGAAALKREVGWVHSSDLSDIHRYLRGGELLLTAGTGIGQTAAEQRAYLRSLADAGACALVLELGPRAFQRPPPPLREEADRLGVAFAILHAEVPFAEVTRTVHGWIVGRRYELVERAEKTAQEFNALLLSGGKIPQVVHKLHELCGNPVVLEDAARQIVEYAAAGPEIDPIIHGWSSHSRHGHSENGGDAAQLSPGTPDCAWTPITVRSEIWGRIHVLALDKPIDQIALIATQRASAAIGIALLSDQHDARLHADALADFVAEAARRAPVDETRFLRQARSLGADFRGRVFGVLAISATPRAIDEAVAAVETIARRRRVPLLRTLDEGIASILVGLKHDGSPGAELRLLADAMSGSVLSDGASATVGVSRVSELPTLPRAFRQAAECVRYSRLTNTYGTVEYSELGLHLLLLALAEESELAQFVENELGPLLTHDTKSSTKLLDTLRVVIEHDGNKARAARALHVERRSVYYRLKRIEEVLGRRLDSYDTRLALGVALRALALIQDRPVEISARRVSDSA
jgi:purine catabolism regulator